jgi:hypothetical protein
MAALVDFILRNGGKGTDYRITVVGVNLMPIGVKLKVEYLGGTTTPDPSINVDIP